MGFKTIWICEHCEHTIFASSEPDETECECYEQPKEKIKQREPMSKEERKERYREQYMRNGYTWNDLPQKMYYGAFIGQYGKQYEDKTIKGT